MKGQFTIALQNLRFFGGHGLYDAEQATGNQFEVSVLLVCNPVQNAITAIEYTVNYAEVYEVVQQVMSSPQQLLETCAQQIARLLQERFPTIQQQTITINKLQPPITGFTGSVGVVFKTEAGL